MVKHLVMWKFKPELTAEQRAEVAANAKAGLEGLVGKIEGLVSLEVGVGVTAGGFDMCLISVHSDISALKNYREHPLHLEQANGKVRPFMCERASCDFEC